MVVNTELAPGIVVYTFPKSKANEWSAVLKEYSEPLLKYGSILSKNDDGYYTKVNLDHRKCRIFSSVDLQGCHQEDPLVVLANEVQQIMDQKVSAFCQHYSAHQAVKNHEAIFLKYQEGDFFTEHNDDCPTYHRTVSSVMYFNDDYNGGEICFKYFNIEYKPKQGDCIVFCSAFPYMHSVNPITSGTRYAAVNWYKYI